MQASIRQKITGVAAALVVAILVLVPFHALLTVWAASVVGHYEALRLWSELLLVPLLLAVVWLVWEDKKLRHDMERSWLVRLIAGYVVLQLLLGCAALMQHQVTAKALGYGLIVNLRPVLFFVAAWVVADRSVWLRGHWQKLVIIPAVVVVSFGLLQALVLPADILRHVGYGPHTITPYETVDQKAQYVRVQSTLRGANPLGAYLVMVLAIVMGGIYRTARWRRWFLLAFGAMATAVLYYTYSRSAYAAAVLTLGGIVWLMTNVRLRRWLLVGLLALLLMGGSATLLLRHNDRFENTFFHTDEHSQSLASSNQKRTSALQGGLHDVVHQPLGLGPGTAGPASVYNYGHPVRLAENYYLQIGQETGWLGLTIFLAINVLLALALWQRRNDTFAVSLVAALVGVSFINMLSHAWTDDTLAYIWWGLAGIALAPGILKTKAEQVDGTNQTHSKKKKAAKEI